MKKLVSLALILGLLVSIAGCSGKQASTPPADTNAPVKIGKVDFAAHGTKCFTVAVAVVQGDKIVAAYLDDYQFMSTDVAKGVPNSDKDFAQSFKDPKMVLASKKVNADYYSKNMAEKAKATKRIDVSLSELEKYAVGKTIAELESKLSGTSKEKMVEAVSGATLQDTHGYLSAILAAAKAAK